MSSETIVEHCFKRAKERVGINRKRAQRMTDLARERGITYEQCNRAADRDYLQRRTKGNTLAIAYNGCCFIIDRDNSQCITIYKLPKWFKKKHKSIRERDEFTEYETDGR